MAGNWQWQVCMRHGPPASFLPDTCAWLRTLLHQALATPSSAALITIIMWWQPGPLPAVCPKPRVDQEDKGAGGGIQGGSGGPGFHIQVFLAAVAPALALFNARAVSETLVYTPAATAQHCDLVHSDL